MQTTVKLLASRHEAAQALGVSVRTIDALAQRGDLRAVWIGTRTLFPWSELRQFVEGIHASDTCSNRGEHFKESSV